MRSPGGHAGRGPRPGGAEAPGSFEAGVPGSLRMAELLAALSLAADLGMGQPMEHALRTCRLACQVAEACGLGGEALVEVYYTALLRWVGCTGNAHELGGVLGGDLESRSDMAVLDLTSRRAGARFVLRHAGAGARPARRASAVARAAAQPPGTWRRLAAAHCESARSLADYIGLPPAVSRALTEVFERWDGRGLPDGRAGDAIAIGARVARLAGDAEILARAGGPPRALAVIAAGAGTIYDPYLAARLAALGGAAWADLEALSSWQATLDAEPGRVMHLEGAALERGLEGMADFVDLKSPFTAGHSRGVADLAGRAAGALGLGEDSVRLTRWAGLVHDLGRAGVSSAIWDKEGQLSEAEWEAVRLHPYLTERTLARSGRLAALVEPAASHHERLDGSGYHRRLPGTALSAPARLIAAADAFCAMGERRPHRAPLTAAQAMAELEREARAGRLDRQAVGAVLAAAGHAPVARATLPAGLTPREAEVLALAARGLRNREIADLLVVSPKTVGHHLQHAYAKAGVTTRAAATLFVVQHGLLDGAPG